jgi:hypothetical protein
MSAGAASMTLRSPAAWMTWRVAASESFASASFGDSFLRGVAADVYHCTDGRIAEVLVSLFIERDLHEDVHGLRVFLHAEALDELAADRGSVSAVSRARNAAPAALPVWSRMNLVKAWAAARRTSFSGSASAVVSASSAFGVPSHATLLAGGGFLTGCVPHHLPSQVWVW